MSDNNTLTTTSVGESTSGEAWKTGSTEHFDTGIETAHENDAADLSPTETLEVDNWLLSQGIDSGTNYVEKISETITTPEKTDFGEEIAQISEQAPAAAEQKQESSQESAMPETEKSENVPAETEIEEEIISPKIVEYFETQDPELVMSSISSMTDVELDRTIELIENGQTEELAQTLEQKKTKAQNQTETKAEAQPLSQTRIKTAWESDPSLPDFTKIDGMRREELKSVILEYRESHKNIETREKQKSSAVVAYDIPPHALLPDVKIVLVKNPLFEDVWMLPQTPTDPKKPEEKETEDRIEESYGLDIEVEEKLKQEEKTLLKTDNSEITSEKNYFMAESDSEKELKRDDMIWVTLADLQSKDFKLMESDIDVIAEAAKEIKEKMEKEVQNKESEK